MPVSGLSDAEYEINQLQGQDLAKMMNRSIAELLTPVFIHHANCADGVCAAWVYSKWMTNKAEFIQATYGDTPPDVRGRDVVIADFSFPRAVLEKMHADARSLVVYDHHQTAQADLEGLSYCHFDMSKSGARLLWEAIRGVDCAAPWLVRYTEDRDLWHWNLVSSKEVSAAIRSYPMTFESWDTLSKRSPEDVATEGAAILRAQDQIVANHVNAATEIDIDGYKVLAVNTTVFQSEIGNLLAHGRPFSATWMERDGKKVWSLRSDNWGIDVAEIARNHGGGGHKHAAGFRS